MVAHSLQHGDRPPHGKLIRAVPSGIQFVKNIADRRHLHAVRRRQQTAVHIKAHNLGHDHAGILAFAMASARLASARSE
jgi:hypothetical protein